MIALIGGLSKLGVAFIKNGDGQYFIIDSPSAIALHRKWLEENNHIYFALDFRFIDQRVLEEMAFFLDKLNNRIDHIIIMSGLNEYKAFQSVLLAEWENVFQVCLEGPVFTVKQLLPYLKDKGNIIAISSMNSIMTHPNRIAYASAKAALNQWIRNLSQELKEQNICVNAILPGYIYEDNYWKQELIQTKENGKNIKDYLIKYKNVVDLTNFLLIENDGAINGQLIVVDKGFSV